MELDGSGSTLLHLAATLPPADLGLVGKLLAAAKNQNVNLKDVHGSTPIDLTKDAEVAKLFLDAGAAVCFIAFSIQVFASLTFPVRFSKVLSYRLRIISILRF